eukprot:1284139-Ditylum_brightwellii.AAC.2
MQWELAGGNMSKPWLILVVDHSEGNHCPCACASGNHVENADQEPHIGDCLRMRCSKQWLILVVDHGWC